jgi:alkane 1-monooxygenase
MNVTTHNPPVAASALEVVAGAYFSYGLFLCLAISYAVGGWTWLLPTLFVMALVPVLDWLSGEDLTTRQVPRDGSFAGNLLRLAPHGFIIGYVICIAITILVVPRLTLLEFALATLSLGMMGSIAITAAHELIHKSTPREKAFGRLGLASVCYLHFEINHVRGHHVQVGTPLDESTAWKGESLYSYIYRTVPGCLQSSWRLEVRMRERQGQRVWSFGNLMLRFVVLQGAYFAALTALGGWAAVGFFLAQSVAAIFMLETVSYVEHYGLLREKLAHDRYGNMTAAHSWDSYHRFSNYLAFHLQRHADHHAAPKKSYAELQPLPVASARLPAGYPVMVTLAMVPPLWRRVMHPRISKSIDNNGQ